jgi:hypothetical protein
MRGIPFSHKDMRKEGSHTEQDPVNNGADVGRKLVGDCSLVSAIRKEFRRSAKALEGDGSRIRA